MFACKFYAVKKQKNFNPRYVQAMTYVQGKLGMEVDQSLQLFVEFFCLYFLSFIEQIRLPLRGRPILLSLE